jgi:hypothetical protein
MYEPTARPDFQLFRATASEAIALAEGMTSSVTGIRRAFRRIGR